VAYARITKNKMHETLNQKDCSQELFKNVCPFKRAKDCCNF